MHYATRPSALTVAPPHLTLTIRRWRSRLWHQVQDVHRVPRRRGDELRRQHRRQEPVRDRGQALGLPPQPPPRRVHRLDGDGDREEG